MPFGLELGAGPGGGAPSCRPRRPGIRATRVPAGLGVPGGQLSLPQLIRG